jgi:hypothetical protein
MNDFGSLRGGYTDEELNAAFKRVQNPDHWKNPCDGIVCGRDLEVTLFAIEFFTGTTGTVTPLYTESAIYEGNRPYRVTAPGYRAGPCN